MQFKAFKLAPLLAMLFLAMALPVEAETQTIFHDDFEGSALNEHRWPWQLVLSGGSISVDGGLLTLTYADVRSSGKLRYGEWIFKVRPHQADKSIWLQLASEWDSDGRMGVIRVEFSDIGSLRLCTYDGVDSYVCDMGSYSANRWYVIRIVWEEGRALCYVNGTLRGVSTQHIPSGLLYIDLNNCIENGSTIDLDYITLESDLEALYDRPILTWFERGWVPDASWNDDTLTYTLSPHLDVWMPLRVYIPIEKRSYLCEVYIGGVKHTDIRFMRCNRTLFINNPSGSDTLEIRLVDPEPWMVQLYYSLLPLGIDIGVLLKAYDRLKAKWKPLPWMLLAIFLLLLAFAIYLAVRLLTGVRV